MDERDTFWEQDTSDFRVLIVSDERVSAYDFDNSSLEEVLEWVRGQSGACSIGLRTRNALDQPGIFWLIRNEPTSRHLARGL